jgi:dTDP-4-dehydrorhamnose reductase
MKKVLILGSQGMLGQELVKVFSSDERYTVTGWDYADIDVTDFAAAEEKIRTSAPEIILNAVAYNAVDACEESDEEYRKVLLLNAEVPKFLARVAKEMSAVFVHYSTDYVFDGESAEGYEEEDEPRPLSRYGESKREGEKNVLAVEGKNYLIRLSKLFGRAAASETAKKSFFEKMLQAAKGKTEVTVVDDELSCFTYAPDLAQSTKDLIEAAAPYGIYHLANSGGATWYEAARELYTQAHIGVTIQPVGSDVFLRKALRPKCSILRNTKRPLLRPYQEALREYLSKM